jgi:hypothetical protein
VTLSSWADNAHAQGNATVRFPALEEENGAPGPSDAEPQQYSDRSGDLADHGRKVLPALTLRRAVKWNGVARKNNRT